MRVLATLWFVTLASLLEAETIRMAVTTSFHNSGLAEVLLPEIEADTSVTIELLVVGTGQALKLGEAGDVDAVLVHAKIAEESFVAAGFGPYRREIMFNDFVIVGPKDDPSGVADATNIGAAFSRLQAGTTSFVSRADNSGTHKAEMRLWALAGISPNGRFYLEVGSGMGAALNTAAALNAYILSDRASWLNFGNKADLAILFEGSSELHNQYALLPVSSIRHAHVKSDAVRRVEDWLVSDKGQLAIAAYRVADQQLFFPNAK